MNFGLGLTVSLEAGVVLAVGTLVLTYAAGRVQAPALVQFLMYSAVVGHFALGCAMQLGGVESDAAGYHSDAIQLTQYWGGDAATSPVMSDGKAGWAWTLALLYSVFDPSVSLGIAVNAVLVGAAPLQTFAITRLLFDEDVARRASVLIWLLPAGWLWGSLPLREASITFILLLALYALLRVARGDGLQWWVVLGMALLLLVVFRGSMAIVVVAGALVATLLVKRGGEWAVGSRVLLVPAALGLALIGQVALNLGGTDLSVERVSAIQQSQSATANSRFEVTAAPTSITDIVLSLPSSFPRALLGPFPWDLGELPVPLLGDAIYWWVIVVLATLGFRRTKMIERRNLVALLLVPFIGLLVALAIYSGNYGTMVRIRATGAIYLVPLAAIALSRAGRTKRPGRRPRAATPDGSRAAGAQRA